MFPRAVIDLLGYRNSYRKIKPNPNRLKLFLTIPFPKSKTKFQIALEKFSYDTKWVSNFSEKI